MINLMPDNMWLTTVHEDLDEDDVDEYGRLVIDIPETSDSTTTKNKAPNENTHFCSQTELRGNNPTLETEKIISSSTENMTKPINKPHKLLPLRINRDIPIKLLLKRTFQNIKNKPHKKRLTMYNAEEEKEQLNENNNTELLLTDEKKSHQLGEHETTETITIAHDYNQRISPQIEKTNIEIGRKIIISSKNHKSFESHNEDISCAEHRHSSNQVEDYVHRRVSPENYTNHTNMSARAAEKKKMFNHSIEHNREKILAIHKNNANQEEMQNRTRIIVDNIIQGTSQNHMKKIEPGTPEIQNSLNPSVTNIKEGLLSTQKHYSNRVEQSRPHIIIDNIDLTVPTQDCTMKSTMSEANSEKQYSVKQAIENYKESTHRYHSNQIGQKTPVIVHSNQNNKENNDKDTSDAQLQSNQFYHTLRQDHKQRISVVSDNFLFQDYSKQDRFRRPTSGRTSQTRKKYERCPQKYQEALIDFMERHYQLAIRENIPLTVNSKPLQQEPQKENPDTMFTEVIHVGETMQPQINPSQKKSTDFRYQLTKTTRVPKKKPSISANESGYNILVHRGPDINRIVITIANEDEYISKIPNVNEDITKTTNCLSPLGDQRVPESIINNISHSEPSHPSQKKRSYYYKEPSLRSFRKRLSNQRSQKQIRNSVEINRFDSPDHFENYSNVSYAQHYPHAGSHYNLPNPVIDNYYTFEPLAQNFLSPVTNAPYPWELYERRPVLSDGISRRQSNVPSSPSPTRCHLDSYEEQIMFRPLNLSLKPYERPYPEFYQQYPIPIQDYY